jgi:hypothetical protein
MHRRYRIDAEPAAQASAPGAEAGTTAR